MGAEQVAPVVVEDRRRRWDKRMIEAGFKRVSFWVPADRVAILKELKHQLVSDWDYDNLRQYVECVYVSMLEDAECDDLDRQYARHRLALLGASPAARSAREDVRP